MRNSKVAGNEHIPTSQHARFPSNVFAIKPVLNSVGTIAQVVLYRTIGKDEAIPYLT